MTNKKGLPMILFKKPPPPTHVELAERELEETRCVLLERRREKETAEAAVRALECRVERLIKYVNEHQKGEVA
jgi:hypothetical protein